ncbi:hypothetical protein CBL_08225 [Carabus blaptoides fortunei]
MSEKRRRYSHSVCASMRETAFDTVTAHEWREDGMTVLGSPNNASRVDPLRVATSASKGSTSADLEFLRVVFLEHMFAEESNIFAKPFERYMLEISYQDLLD